MGRRRGVQELRQGHRRAAVGESRVRQRLTAHRIPPQVHGQVHQVILLFNIYTIFTHFLCAFFVLKIHFRLTCIFAQTFH